MCAAVQPAGVRAVRGGVHGAGRVGAPRAAPRARPPPPAPPQAPLRRECPLSTHGFDSDDLMK